MLALRMTRCKTMNKSYGYAELPEDMKGKKNVEEKAQVEEKREEVLGQLMHKEAHERLIKFELEKPEKVGDVWKLYDFRRVCTAHPESSLLRSHRRRR